MSTVAAMSLRFLVRTIILSVGGGFVGFAESWIVASFYGGPEITTTYVEEVRNNAVPVGTIFGVLAGALLAALFERRKRQK